MKEKNWNSSRIYLLSIWGIGSLGLFIAGSFVAMPIIRILLLICFLTLQAVFTALLLIGLRKYSSERRAIIELLESRLSPLKEDSIISASRQEDVPLIQIIDDYTIALQEGYEIQLTKKQAHLTALQSQINPHFLYNTLDSIRGKALESNMREIANMIAALSSFFRYNISKSSSIVPLRDEIHNIEIYFQIQQFRFNNRFSLIIENEDMVALDYHIPKLTLQPLVENSIFHGLEPKYGPGVITIRITMTKSRLLINISDNGVGIPAASLEKLQMSLFTRVRTPETTGSHTSIGLYNVNERIKLIFGPAYGLFISSMESVGTEIELVLPLIHKPNEITKLYEK